MKIRKVEKSGLSLNDWLEEVKGFESTSKCTKFAKYSDSGTLVAYFDQDHPKPSGWVDFTQVID